MIGTSQKLGKVFGHRKDPDAEPELDPVSESDSDPSVNFSMGKKHSKFGTARVCPPRTLGWETPRHHIHVNHVNHVFKKLVYTALSKCH